MLKFDIHGVLSKIQRGFDLSKRYVDSVSVTLPFGTINLKPTSIELDTAKELVIFLSDRRVLNSNECCDDCISAALASLQEIRTFLVQKQLVLKNHTDSILYLLIETMLTEIRQFQTYVQQWERHSEEFSTDRSTEGDTKQPYFSALKTLRAGLLALLSQVANIARIKIDNRLFADDSNIVVSSDSGYLVLWQKEEHLLIASDVTASTPD